MGNRHPGAGRDPGCKDGPSPGRPLPNASLRPAGKLAGFTLVELAIVITIIAVVTAVSVDMGQGMIQSADIVATNHKLNVIEQALEAYRLGNERLPCPADASALSTSAYYGYEAGTLSGSQWVPDMGVCTTSGTYTTTTSGGYTSGVLTGTTANSVAANYNVLIPKGANATNIAFNTYVVEGAVPFKALGLPESFMYDAWGRKFAYAVWAPDTAEGAFLNYGITPSCGAITVNDASGNHRSQSSIYAVASLGPDGHGGYVKDGTRTNAKSVNADEDANGHYSSAGANINYTATYVEKAWSEDPTNSHNDYSDLVRFKERWQMTDRRDYFSPTGLPCTPGFRIDGTIASQQVGANGMKAMDINGDGIADLIITSLGNHHLYILFGQSSASSFPNPIKLPTDCNGANCVDIDLTGTYATERWANSGAMGLYSADINGDGVQDLVILSTRGGCEPTYATVIFGQTTPWPTTITVSSATTSSSPPVLKINTDGSMGNSCNGLSFTVGHITNVTNTVGVNTYNVDDMILGEPNQDGDGGVNANSGNVYAIFGNPNINAIATTATQLDGSKGVLIEGYRSGAGGGRSVAVGDFNGDGVKDIAIGAPDPGPGNNSYGYIIWGRSAAAWLATGGTLHLNALSGGGSDGFEIERAGGGVWSACSALNGYFGTMLRVGDINGDGYDDALFESQNGCAGTVGNVYAIFGAPASSWTSNTFDVNSIDASNSTKGVRFRLSQTTNDNKPNSLMLADTTGICTSSPCAMTLFMPTQGWNGCCPYYHFVAFYPQTTPWPNPFSVTALTTGSNGFSFTGLTGTAGSGALGDVNGDNINDYLMADTGANSSAGAVYIIKGGQSLPASVTPATLASYGFEIDGATAGDQLGKGITLLDIDHNGITDIATCAPNASYGAANSGSCYVIWGHKGNWLTKLNLNVLN